MAHGTGGQNRSRPWRWIWTALSASILIPSLLFVSIALLDRTRRLEEAAQAARQTADLLSEHTLKVVETHDLLLRELLVSVKGMDWSEIKSDADRISGLMQAMLVGRPQVSGLGLTDADGRVWVFGSEKALQRPVTGTSVVGRDYWAAQRDGDKGIFIGKAYVGNNTGVRNFGISRRLNGPGDTFAGTVHAAVATPYLTGFWTTAISNSPDAAVSLIRTDGEVLARIPQPDGPIPPLSSDTHPLMQAISRSLDNGTFEAASAYDGKQRIVAYNQVGSLPLVLTYAVSKEDVLAGWWHDISVLGIIFLAAILALVLSVSLVALQTRRLAKEREHRAKIEQAAQDGQRMELLGQLAAGVAHDFYNVIQAVQSGATLLVKSANDPDRTRSLAHMIDDAARHGAALTRHLTEFARRGGADDNQDNATVDPAEAITMACQFVAGITGARHQVLCEIEQAGMPALVRGDQTGLEAAVMNLVVNARDAMPDGGDIIVRAAPEHVINRHAHAARLEPGLYVKVTVTDTGIGMPPGVAARAAELFFTTKPKGEGTGLGLAGARGFAERAGGALRIETALGVGTTVSLWLPAQKAIYEIGVAEHFRDNVTPIGLSSGRVASSVDPSI